MTMQDQGNVTQTQGVSSPAGQPSLFGRLRSYFLAGIVVTAPITLTIYLTWAFLQWIDDHVSQILPPEYNPNSYLQFSVPGLGLVIAVVFFTLVGWFARNVLGRLLIRFSEYIVHRMPVIRSVYSAIKQVFETVMGGKSQAFREVVLFEYPRKGIWAMGFVTGAAAPEISAGADRTLVNVFIPWSPPTSGILIFLPREDLVTLNISVENAFKMFLSGGILAPQDPQNSGPASEGVRGRIFGLIRKKE